MGCALMWPLDTLEFTQERVMLSCSLRSLKKKITQERGAFSCSFQRLQKSILQSCFKNEGLVQPRVASGRPKRACQQGTTPGGKACGSSCGVLDRVLFPKALGARCKVVFLNGSDDARGEVEAQVSISGPTSIQPLIVDLHRGLNERGGKRE